MSRSSSKSSWVPLLVIGTLVALASVYSLSGRDKIDEEDSDVDEPESYRETMKRISVESRRESVLQVSERESHFLKDGSSREQFNDARGGDKKTPRGGTGCGTKGKDEAKKQTCGEGDTTIAKTDQGRR